MVAKVPAARARTVRTMDARGRRYGRGSSQDSALSDEFFAALAKAGSSAPMVALPYGGDHSYWHNRASGEWASYVMDEVIPEVAHQYGADENRVAIGGISMGGFGAFDLALHYPWQTGDETAADAFDDEEDFSDYWNAHWGEYMRFYANALANCHRPH
jgi:hypothetical protein